MTELPYTQQVFRLLAGTDAGKGYDILEIVRSLETQLEAANRDLRAVRLGRDKVVALYKAAVAAKENAMDGQVTPAAIPPRPGPARDELLRAVAGELAGQVLDWLEDEAELYSQDEIAGQVYEALDTEYRWNGANLAAWFKSKGWEIDMELAEILDEAQAIYRRLT